MKKYFKHLMFAEIRNPVFPLLIINHPLHTHPPSLFLKRNSMKSVYGVCTQF